MEARTESVPSPVSQKVPLRDRLRSIAIVLAVVFYTLLLGPVALLILLIMPGGTGTATIVKLWARIILETSGVRVEYAGIENVQEGKGQVFVSNHQSQYDVLALIAGLPTSVRFVAKKSLYRIPLFGWILAAGGHIKIDRSDRERAIASYDKAAEKIRNGTCVIVFAEGTRSPDGTLGPFKKGGFVLAIKSDAPIVPVTVKGGHAIMPKERLITRSGRMSVILHKPIDASEYSYEDRDRLIGRVRRVIAEDLGEA
jgi:1-acyl-sn-glycerol-3-phosphate acyltransferase